MSNVYFIGCLHFGHENLIKNIRGFKNIKEHDNLIIHNWNKRVNKKDKVYILGDITMENKNYEILNRLNGTKIVVMGNHDLEKHTHELLKYVKSVVGCLKYNDYFVTHIPIHPSELEYRVKGNIHAHVHCNDIQDHRYINVDAQALNYTPINYLEIEAIFNKNQNNGRNY